MQLGCGVDGVEESRPASSTITPTELHVLMPINPGLPVAAVTDGVGEYESEDAHTDHRGIPAALRCTLLLFRSERA